MAKKPKSCKADRVILAPKKIGTLSIADVNHAIDVVYGLDPAKKRK